MTFASVEAYGSARAAGMSASSMAASLMTLPAVLYRPRVEAIGQRLVPGLQLAVRLLDLEEPLPRRAVADAEALDQLLGLRRGSGW